MNYPVRGSSCNENEDHRMTTFRVRDIFILGFLNFALFVGAGNIIFPPLIGLQAGTCFWAC